MRIDSSSVNPQFVNPYCAAAEKLCAERRPLQARKRAAKRGAGSQAWAGTREALTIGQWMSAGKKQPLPESRPRAGGRGKAPECA